ncbi:hypothetical protein GCM10012275_07070 [Longimycelium tulufanense]|uniref:Uncharacterized protein n=1 Tax=Longimycelium tulufanense TaxID=907463 RepID=A0A8J3C6A1_9PSEU|nr:hypothetical protein [Longimycelium tulufanense]GGM38737.1 hypothetical protein GCM10012275_07070 [Longimycelium tulufanense]
MDPDRDYWHKLEFFEIRRGVRKLLYSAAICDHGFYVGRRAGVTSVQATAERYAREIGEDFVRDMPGRWLVRVSRITPPSEGGETIQQLCTVELRGATPQPTQAASLAAESR